MPKLIVRALIEQWHAHAADRAAQHRLITYRATPSTCIVASTHFGSRLLGVLEQTPYTLMDVRGIGFTTADRIAQGCGIVNESPERLWAALTHVVQSATAEGHYFALQDNALSAAAHLVDQPVATLAVVLKRQLWVRSLRYAERGWPKQSFNPQKEWPRETLATNLAQIRNAGNYLTNVLYSGSSIGYPLLCVIASTAMILDGLWHGPGSQNS